MKNINVSPYIILVVTIIIAAVTLTQLGFEHLKMDPEFDFTKFSIILQQIILISLFVERSIKILFPDLEPPELESLTRKISSFNKASRLGINHQMMFKNAPMDINRAIEEQSTLKKQKYEKSRFLQIVAGLLISIIGFRLLGEMVNIGGSNAQQYSFQIIDIIITGLLIGGGASGLEKIIDYIKERIG